MSLTLGCCAVLSQYTLGLLMFSWSLSLPKQVDSVFLEKLVKLYWVHLVTHLWHWGELSYLKTVAQGILGRCPGSCGLVMVTAVTILKGYISCVFNEKMGFEWRLGDISFCINSILIIPKTLAIDLNAYWFWCFVSPSVLLDFTCKGYWVSYFERDWMEKWKFNF